MFPRQASQAQDAADGFRPIPSVSLLGDRTDMRAELAATRQQLGCGSWCVRGLVLVGDTMLVALLATVFAQQLPGTRVQHPHGVAYCTFTLPPIQPGGAL